MSNKEQLLITDASVSGIIGDLGRPESTRLALDNLDIRNFYIETPDQDQPSYFWYLPRDSKQKVGVITSLADALEQIASNNLDPNTRVLATEKFFDLCTNGYVSSEIGISKPEETLQLPNRLLRLIDSEQNASVKGSKLDVLVGAYWESVLHTQNRAQILYDDWFPRVESFIHDSSHPLESISLLRDFVCRTSGWASDGSHLECIKMLFGLKDLQGIVQNAEDVDLKSQSREAAILAYKGIMKKYKDDWERRPIVDFWTSDAMDIIFPQDSN